MSSHDSFRHSQSASLSSRVELPPAAGFLFSVRWAGHNNLNCNVTSLTYVVGVVTRCVSVEGLSGIKTCFENMCFSVYYSCYVRLKIRGILDENTNTSSFQLASSMFDILYSTSEFILLDYMYRGNRALWGFSIACNVLQVQLFWSLIHVISCMIKFIRPSI